jgi:nitroreductase
MFSPRPVPRELIDEALALAQHAPSNSNIQPWRMVFAAGAARDRLKDALLDVAGREAPNIPALPDEFRHYRRGASRPVEQAGRMAARDRDLHQPRADLAQPRRRPFCPWTRQFSQCDLVRALGG